MKTYGSVVIINYINGIQEGEYKSYHMKMEIKKNL